MKVQNVTLYIDLILYGLEPQNIKFRYTTGALEKIDKLTYNHLNEEDFFARKKADIMKRLRTEANLYNIRIQPTDIELGDKIYIIKEDKKIHPLFQEINTKDKTIILEDLIKKRMLEGNLFNLYFCDKERQKDYEYESVFLGCSEILLAKIEMNLLGVKDIESIWSFLKTRNRIYSIMRLLLLKAPLSVMAEKFVEKIPLVEDLHQPKSGDSHKLERYRYPYNDD